MIFVFVWDFGIDDCFFWRVFGFMALECMGRFAATKVCSGCGTKLQRRNVFTNHFSNICKPNKCDSDSDYY